MKDSGRQPYASSTSWDLFKEIDVGIEVSDAPIDFDPFLEDDSVDSQMYKRAWARLLAKVYERDPFVCPKCGSAMKEGIQMSEEFFDNPLCHKDLPIVVKNTPEALPKITEFWKSLEYAG